MKWVWRIGGGLLVVLLLAVAVLLAMGQRANAGRVHASAEVQASPQQLWTWLNEPAKLKQWVSGLVEIREDPSKRGGVGDHEVWVMRDENNGGQLMEIEAVCEEYVPLSRITVHVWEGRDFDGRQTYTLVDLGNGRTRLDIDGQYRFMPWFARLMEPVITPMAAKKLAGDVARMKSLIEQAHSN